MNKRAKTFVERQREITHYLRLAMVAAVVFVLMISVLIVRLDTKASSDALSKKVVERSTRSPPKPTPKPTPLSNIPPQTPATRISIIVGDKHDLQVATGVDSFVMVSPEFASAEIRNRFTLSISAIKIGETILLITYGKRRHTYIIDVVPKPSGSSKRSDLNDINGVPRKQPAASGSFTTLYARGSGGGASLVRQNVDFRRKLSNGRTLRVAGEMFKLFGNQSPDLAIARVRDFALNRMSVGLDTAGQKLDLLDSQINISPLSLNNYSMRGFHLTKTPKLDPKANLQKKGIEVYAGLARPSLAFFDTNGGKIAGAMIPVITADNFQARAGFTAISADRNSRQVRGGVIVQADAAYAPTKEIFADAEISYANGDLSWRGRLDLKYPNYGVSAEMRRFARSSPLNSIGAQSGGLKSESLSFYWRPVSRLSTSIGFNHARVSRQTNSQLADYGQSLLFANASYAITTGSQINLRYTDQKIETAFPGSLSKFQIETRTLLIGNNHRFSKAWSNTIEGRINFNREANANAVLEKGFSLSEQLRFAWSGGSLTGFFYYNRKSPSLTSLIVRNPQLLPPALQAAFALDPAEFLRVNRDRIAFLLAGIELPQTRSMDAGVRFQKTFSRLTVSGETRYNAGEVYAVSQKQLYASASVGIRLDKANLIQVNGWKSFGGRGQSGVTVSYTHQFGSSGDGFQLSRLFSFSRAKVRGRVYYDLNANGVPDPAEPGVSGMKIQIDGKRSVITDNDGRYDLAANEGRHSVVLVSEALGVRLLASTPTEQSVDLSSGQKLNLNFGVRDSGSISGRVFNDTRFSTADESSNNPGLSGVKVILRSTDTGFGSFVLEQVTNAGGTYDFRNLRPGRYLIEIDPASVPADFQIPGITASSLNVEPLLSAYYDIPIQAQRAITGNVFIDKDGDGRYTPGRDEPVAGVYVMVNGKTVVSDAGGAYIHRNLPPGKTQLMVRSPNGVEIFSIVVELGTEPVTRRAIDFPINR